MVAITDDGTVLRNCPSCGSTASSNEDDYIFRCWNKKCKCEFIFEPKYYRGQNMDKCVITKESNIKLVERTLKIDKLKNK